MRTLNALAAILLIVASLATTMAVGPIAGAPILLLAFAFLVIAERG